ncbi:MAG: sulfotransferase [Myxococcota bacterium]
MTIDLSEQYPRPDWVRRINAMGDSVGGDAHLIPIEVDELVELAKASTGLSDFGDFDGDWRARLTALVSDMNGPAKLSTIGRLMSRQEILRCLRTRLLMQEQLRQHPAILEEEIKAPIIVTGQARSGTTILFELLAEDPNARAVMGWESAHPVAGGEDRDALIAMTECEQEFWCDVQPEYASIHEHRSDIPVECITPTMPSFGSFMWFITNHTEAWSPDFVSSMQFHKVYLQMMQYQKPKATWILKTPVYLPVLDLVFSVYPDAWILLSHRDPMKTIPSGLSTLANVRWQRSREVDMSGIVAGGTAIFDLMVHIQNRRQSGDLPDRLLDIHFRDQMSDPVEAIRRLYAQMGRSFESEHADRIRRYLENKPKGKHGTHHYDVSDWGYTKDEVREKTRAYVDAYSVELED